MEYLDIKEFDNLNFMGKMKYLHSALKDHYSGSDSCLDYNPVVEKGCDYLFRKMEERMEEKTENYRFNFDILKQNEFEKKFGSIDGVCTKDLDIHLNQSVLRDPLIYGGTTLFHERITKGIKQQVGQLIPILEECLVNRALMISLGSYEEFRPSKLYDKLKENFNDSIDKMFLDYKGGEKFQSVFKFITSQDENENKRKIVPSYISGISDRK
jgi:hypothetical protein